MRKIDPFVLASVLCFFCFSVYAEEKQQRTTLTDNIQKAVNEIRLRYHLPAISLSIKLPNNDEISNFVSGNFSLNHYKRINPNTLFQVGSITKTFTASIIFKLIEDDKLNLQDNLGKWLPEYPKWKDITIDELLHHTSGIYNYTNGKLFDRILRKRPYKNWSLKELANIAYKHPALYKPGTQYNYSNTDYILLGLIIEKATNRPLQLIFNEYLKKYALNRSFYTPFKYTNQMTNNIAHGYNRDGTFPMNTDITYNSLSFAQSSGAILSTPNDLVKWLIALFSGKIIHNKSLEEMTKIISEKDAQPIHLKDLSRSDLNNHSKLIHEVGVGAGLGLVYLNNGTLAWVHSGGTLGYESFYAYSPCSGIYLALTYSAKPKHQFTFIEITDVLLKEINSSPEVQQGIKAYQKQNPLPDFCKS
ncbi:serine hydrolase domain-containing protein [Legionella waltersii]|uniref:serine hydrolase domain-containing protein n=1 Tax=Legionella waltersii TaxID=66969 RepID=UPI00072FCDAC|nr:serine hydrolase [Legionella waltersii]